MAMFISGETSSGVIPVGSKKQKTTQTYQPPTWVEGGARRAVDLGQKIGSQQYEAYTGSRVAPLSRNEELGISRAASTAGAAQPYYNRASEFAEKGTASWLDADQQAYMNPFIKGALDPAAREIRQEGARGAEQIAGQYASLSAFGGSRAALAESENREKTLQQISDLYGKGFAQAYESGVNIWGDERAREMQAAGRFQDLGTAVTNANTTDISTLMATGATDRSVQQAFRDFDYQQFIEERDWDFRNLGGLIAALEGTKGSYGTTTTSETKQSGGELAQALGIAATLVGVFYGGPAGGAAAAAATSEG